MIGLTLHPMKEIRIVVQGEHLKFVTDLLDRSGPRGTRSSITYPGRAITVSMKAICCSTDTSSQVIVFTVVPEERVEPILAGVGPLFNKHSGTMFVTDTAVSRREHFVAE